MAYLSGTLDDLLGPVAFPSLDLANRIVLSPMTRSRADRLGVLPDYAADYYGARAAGRGGAGLLITEGNQTSFVSQGYVRTPGIHTTEQVLAWRKVTRAVHDAGGRIFLQLMPVGRISSHYNRVTDEPPVAPSAIRAPGEIHTDTAGMQPHDMPRELALSEIPTVIEELAIAARNAMLAGFDGVELHAMGAYLPVQFLSSSANHRTDAYGGPPQRRVRFVVEALEAMAAAVGGADKIALRISPGFAMFGIQEDAPELLYTTLLDAIAPLGLAYLHVLEMHRLKAPPGIDLGPPAPDFLPLVRRHFHGTLIAAGNFTAHDALATLANGRADLIAFGRPFIGNPDLASAFASGRTLTEIDPAFYYSAGPQGYTELP